MLVNPYTVKTRIKEPPYLGVRLAKVLKSGRLTGHFAHTVGRGRGNENYCQTSLLVAARSVEGHICFTKLFLLKMGCKISGWRFLKCWLFYVGFYCICVVN